MRENSFAFIYILLSAVALTHRDNDRASNLLSPLVKKGGVKPMPELQIKKVLRIIQRLFFLLLNKSIYCNPSLEQSPRDSSNEAGFL